MSRGRAEELDVLVIGGGPAGGMAGMLCARMGLRTMMVERCALPRGKVCGCCLTAAGVATLQEAGVGDVIAEANRVTRMRLCSGRRSAAFAMPTYRVLSREDLDMRLWQHAQRSGAVTLDATSATVHEDGTVTLQRSDRVWDVAAACVIAADGIGGTSLRERGVFAWDVQEASHMGLGVTLAQAPLAMSNDELWMIVTDDGYAGLVMLPDGRVDVAAAASPASVRAAGGAAAWLTEVLAVQGADTSGVRTTKVHGTPLLTRRRRNVASGNVLLTGDAAGYVEPFTGEGMTWALRTGADVAEFAGRMVAARREQRTEVAQSWAARWQELMAPRHVSCSQVARCLRMRWMREASVTLAALAPAAGSLVARHVLASREVAA